MKNTAIKENKATFASFMKTRRGRRMTFYALICALPVLQFCIFTLYINFNSIKMAFESYWFSDDQNATGMLSKFAGFQNFVDAWNIFKTKGYMIWNSIGLLASNIFITIPLALIFSFYLAKECRFTGFFKVILYMPNIISPMIFALLYQRILNGVLPNVSNGSIPALLNPAGIPPASYGAVLFFNIWVSFGVNVLMFTGAMSGINVSIIEAAHLDGANIVQEFWYVSVPMIFATVSTFVILGMTTLFTNQMHLYTMFGINARGGLETIGYFMYVQSERSDYVPNPLHKEVQMSYPVLAAFGLILTLIIAPITFLARKLFDKYGPSED